MRLHSVDKRERVEYNIGHANKVSMSPQFVERAINAQREYEAVQIILKELYNE